jgi:hypothetical protein
MTYIPIPDPLPVTGVVGSTISGSVAVTGVVGATQGTSPWVTTATVQGTAVVQGILGTTQSGGWAVSATQGTSPWVVSAAAVGATQATSPWVVSVTQFAGTTLGATAVTNYGSTPAAVAVPAVNAFITNVPTVNQQVIGCTQSTSPWVVSAAAVGTTQGTSPWIVAGTLTTNTAAPAANNIGVLPAIANANTPSYTEGDQVLLSVNLGGLLRAKSNVFGNSGAIVDAVITATTAPANALAILGVYNSTAPALTTGQSVAVQCDKAGNLFHRPFRRSDMVTKALTITSTSTATTLFTAGAAGVYTDLTNLVITPTPLAGTTASIVFTATISDGTNNYIFDMISGNAGVTGTADSSALGVNVAFNPPLTAAVAATTWTAALSVATVQVHIVAAAVRAGTS